MKRFESAEEQRWQVSFEEVTEVIRGLVIDVVLNQEPVNPNFKSNRQILLQVTFGNYFYGAALKCVCEENEFLYKL